MRGADLWVWLAQLFVGITSPIGTFGTKIKAFLKGGYENVFGLSDDNSLAKLEEVVTKRMKAYNIEIKELS